MQINRRKLIARLSCLICVVFALDLPFGFPRQREPEKPIETTICDIVKHPETFVGKLVRFHAIFLSDGMDRSTLRDRKCKGGIAPRTSAEVDSHPDIKEFDRALSQGNMGTMDKDVTATFTGRFQCKPNCTAIGGRMLEIEQISDLQVTMIKSKKQ